MAASAGVHLIAAAGVQHLIDTTKHQHAPLFATSFRFEIKHSCPQVSLRALLLPPILSISSHRHRFFPSSSTSTGIPVVDEKDEEEAGQKLKDYLPRSSSTESRRLYVGNLPFTTTSSDLSEIFCESGKVDKVEVIYGRATNRSRGFAFVTMATAEDANNAILMFNGTQIGGRTVKVNFPEVPKGGEREVMGPKLRATSRIYTDSPHKIYGGNLGWTVTSEELREAFSAYSGLLGAKVIYERDSGRSRGFGFISFASAEECQSALEAMNGKMVAGRPLRLNLASEKTRSTMPLSLVEDSTTSVGNGHHIDLD